MIIQSKGHCIACGTLPRDAQYRQVGSKQSSLTTFGIKVDEVSVEGHDKPQAKWLDCKCWHKVAKFASMLEKGDTVMVIGMLMRENWTDKSTGELKEKTVLDCQMIIPQQSADYVSPATEQGGFDDGFTDMGDDSDVPF